TPDEIIATSCRVDKRAGGKLKGVGQITAWIGKVLQRRCIQSCGCIGILRIKDRSLAADLNGLIGMCDLESKIDSLLLAQGGGYGVVLLWFEALGLHLHRVYPRLQLWKVEAAGVVGTRASPQASVLIRDRHRSIRHRCAGCIANLADDRAGSFTLGESCFGHETMERYEKDKYRKNWTQHACRPQLARRACWHA